MCGMPIVMAMPKGQCDASSCYCGNVNMFWGGLKANLFFQDLGKIIIELDIYFEWILDKALKLI